MTKGPLVSASEDAKGASVSNAASSAASPPEAAAPKARRRRRLQRPHVVRVSGRDGALATHSVGAGERGGAVGAPAPSSRQKVAEILGSLRQWWDPEAYAFTREVKDVVSVQEIEWLCRLVLPVLRGHVGSVVDVEADCWVIGDIHGNFGDLLYFIQELLPFDVSLCPYNIVCLGDYVDRGPHSIACLLLLLCGKALEPAKVTLLRGNHEDPAVCGDVDQYGEGSFKQQCQIQYGVSGGESVYALLCDCFAELPLAAVIDKRVFCAHGGIPRFFPRRSEQEDPSADHRLDLLRGATFPRFHSLFSEETCSAVRNAPTEEERRLREREWVAAYDLLWSDPVRDATIQLDDDGFSASDRGGQAVTFSAVAVEAFLRTFGFDLMIRAHQEKRLGLRVSQSNKVITVFSSSNYQNHGNGAGVVLIRKGCAPERAVHLIMKTC